MITKTAKWLTRSPVHLIIVAIGIIWLLPTVGLLISSLRPAGELSATGWWTLLGHPFEGSQYTISNYIKVLFQNGMGNAFLNSFIITIPATVFPIIIAMFAAYALSWMEFRGRQVLFIVIVGLIVVPLQITFIPILKTFNAIGFTAGTWPFLAYVRLWLAHTGYGLPLLVYMSRNFIGGLPRELFESASIDGASHWTAFTKLVIPLSVPVIASLSIFQFLWVWNDLIVALIFLGGGGSTAPLTLKISSLNGAYGQTWYLLTSAAFVSMVVPLIIFFALQRYFVRGILAGSLKG